MIWEKDSTEGWNKAATSDRNVSVREFVSGHDQLVAIDDEARITLYERKERLNPVNDVYTSLLTMIGTPPSTAAILGRGEIVVGDRNGNVRFLSLKPQKTLALTGMPRPETTILDAERHRLVAFTKGPSGIQLADSETGTLTGEVQANSWIQGLAALSTGIAVSHYDSVALYSLGGELLDRVELQGVLGIEGFEDKILVRTGDRIVAFEVVRDRLSRLHEVSGRHDAARFTADATLYTTLGRREDGRRSLTTRRIADGSIVEETPDALAMVGNRLLIARETETSLSTHLVGNGSLIELRACSMPIADIDTRGRLLFIRCEHEHAYRIFDEDGRSLGSVGDDTYVVDRIRLSNDGTLLLGMQTSAPEVRMWRIMDLDARARDLCDRYGPHLQAIASKNELWAARAQEYCSGHAR